jgi:calcineurin-like phosphoesterase family protein/hemolysin type calcium-binding protein/purple acid phosphatase-like protein
VASLVLASTASGFATNPASADAAQLKRYPYLTDLVRSSVTVNWATSPSARPGFVRWGSTRQSCTGNSLRAVRRAIRVNGAPRYQWRATIGGLRGNRRYCYRVFLGSTDLLGGARSPRFRAQVPRGSRKRFSFAVFGDWGLVGRNGRNAHQANVMRQIARSGVRFAVTTGDVPYSTNQPRGSSDTPYGDLVYRKSAVFKWSFWGRAGRSIPLFVAPGNHGRNASFLRTWPQPRAVATSHGRYRMERYCCLNGTTAKAYPSAWYAFSAGKARFYVLDTSWSDSNRGDADLYENDYDYHWRPTSDEYRWLKRDLASHGARLKLAFFHFPPWSDNPNESSDRWLRGAHSLEGLLTRYGVRLAFNGHAHMYERNRRSRHNLVTYVTGGGGARLVSIGRRGCSRFDAYGIGWSHSRRRGSACGRARVPASADRVYHFLKVTIRGVRITVRPIDERGRRFDVRTYWPPPTAPRALRASVLSPRRVFLHWRPSSVARGTVRYQVFRNGRLRAITTNLFLRDRTRAGGRYLYRVRAFVGSRRNVSRWSNRLVAMLGRQRRDVLRGSRYRDVIAGFRGRDVIDGGARRDRIFGGRDADRLKGGPGRDWIYGGRGSDWIDSKDRYRDLVAGGNGRDRARWDRRDLIRDVEVRL